MTSTTPSGLSPDLQSMAQAQRLIEDTLRRCGANLPMAAATARALVLAEAQGLGSHGLSRVVQYATHLRNGRANGAAVPTVVRSKGAAAVVDAQQGLAFAACELAVSEAAKMARELGCAFVGVSNSHHCGVVVDHLRPLAQQGLVGIGLANSPSAMPMAGGKHPVFGTNPIAALFPRVGQLPLLIDLSLSEVARGKIMVAAKNNQEIPLGWALDEHGEPTRDPKAALKGSMLPLGAATSPKGAMLALVVELLVTAVIGAQFGFEASSFFVDEGNQPKIGQAFLVIDPSALAGRASYDARMEVLVAEMQTDPDVRLPGVRREKLLIKAREQGIVIPASLIAQWQAL